MDRSASRERGFNGTGEARYMIKRGLNQNCQKKPDFIEDVLLQKDLYASYDMIQENPAYEPTYTFTEPDPSSNEFNPTPCLCETDNHRPFITGEHGMSCKEDCSYGTNKGSILPTVDPIFDTVVEGHNFEEAPSTQVWQQDINVDLIPEFIYADRDISCKGFFSFCMDQDRLGVDLAAVDAPELTMNRDTVETTIDVSDYEVDPFVQVEQKNINIVEQLKLPHIENKIIAELADHDDNQNWEDAALDISDLPQLSMDAIPMENILEGFDNEEVPFMQVDCDSMNIDSLCQILSGIENVISSEPFDINASDILRVNNDASQTEQNEAMSGVFTDKENHEGIIMERNVCSPVPLGISLGGSLEGQSRSKSPLNSGETHRRSQSLSCGGYKSPTNKRNWHSHSKLLRFSRSPVKSSSCYRRSPSRSVTNSRSIHRRSSSRSQSRFYSRALQRRSDSQSRVNSRDCHRRSQSPLKFGTDSGGCSRRTQLRSRSPITGRDHKRRSHSRSPSNSRGSHRRSRSRTVTNSRSSHRRSHSRPHTLIFSRDHDRRSYSGSRVNSRDCQRRSQLKVGMKSSGSHRRTCSRSRSPITFRDCRRTVCSRSLVIQEVLKAVPDHSRQETSEIIEDYLIGGTGQGSNLSYEKCEQSVHQHSSR